MKLVSKSKQCKKKSVKVDGATTLDIEYSEREARIYFNNKLLTQVAGDFEEVCFPHPAKNENDICLERKDILEVGET